MGHMQCQTVWQSEMQFVSHIRNHQVVIDAKEDFGGKNSGPSPKELMLTSITGCTAMDVVSLLKKMRVEFDSISVSAETETTEGHPAIFKEVRVVYDVKGSQVAADKVLKSVEMSMTKYCGVTAMIAEAAPVTYVIKVNGQQTASGNAKFK